VSIVLFVALAVPATLLLTSSVATAAIVSFTTALTAGQEVPPNGSAGAGTATVAYNTTTNQITLTGSFSGLSAPATMAHIHGPAAPGSNASILFPLTVDFATSGNLSLGATTITGPQLTQLQTGQWYVNIHTVPFSSGEIRGQLGVPSAPRAVTAGTGGQSGKATMTFQAPTANGGSPITRYTAVCKSPLLPTGVASTPGSTPAPITVTGLTNGKTYKCTVQARNARGLGALSRSLNVFAGTPSPPVSVTSQKGPSPGSIRVNWGSAFTFAGAPITGFLAVCQSGANQKLVQTNALLRTTVISGLNRALSYVCKVAARNMFGFGLSKSAPAITPT
jgi:hypothetical protein